MGRYGPRGLRVSVRPHKLNVYSDPKRMQVFAVCFSANALPTISSMLPANCLARRVISLDRLQKELRHTDNRMWRSFPQSCSGSFSRL